MGGTARPAPESFSGGNGAGAGRLLAACTSDGSGAWLTRSPAMTIRMIRIPTMFAITSRNESDPNSSSAFLTRRLICSFRLNQLHAIRLVTGRAVPHDVVHLREQALLRGVDLAGTNI